MICCIRVGIPASGGRPVVSIDTRVASSSSESDFMVVRNSAILPLISLTSAGSDLGGRVVSEGEPVSLMTIPGDLGEKWRNGLAGNRRWTAVPESSEPVSASDGAGSTAPSCAAYGEEINEP